MDNRHHSAGCAERRNLKKQTVLITQRRIRNAFPVAHLPAFRKSSDKRTWIRSCSCFTASDEFSRSPQPERIESLRVLRKPDFRIRLPVNNRGFLVAFVLTTKTGTLERPPRSFKRIGSDENVVIVLRPQFQRRGIVRQQRDSFKNGVLYMRLLERMDDRPELLKDFRGSTLSDAALLSALLMIRKERHAVVSAIRRRNRSCQPAEIEPRQSPPIPLALKVQGPRGDHLLTSSEFRSSVEVRVSALLSINWCASSTLRKSAAIDGSSS